MSSKRKRKPAGRLAQRKLWKRMVAIIGTVGSLLAFVYKIGGPDYLKVVLDSKPGHPAVAVADTTPPSVPTNLKIVWTPSP